MHRECAIALLLLAQVSAYVPTLNSPLLRPTMGVGSRAGSPLRSSPNLVVLGTRIVGTKSRQNVVAGSLRMADKKPDAFLDASVIRCAALRAQSYCE
jgi:hypothetical protein